MILAPTANDEHVAAAMSLPPRTHVHEAGTWRNGPPAVHPHVPSSPKFPMAVKPHIPSAWAARTDLNADRRRTAMDHHDARSVVMWTLHLNRGYTDTRRWTRVRSLCRHPRQCSDAEQDRGDSLICSHDIPRKEDSDRSSFLCLPFSTRIIGSS